MDKISIIGGAGTLGAAVANNLATNQQINEICLIDINENLLLNHIMDLQNAFPAKALYAGSYEDLKNSSIIIVTAGIPNRNDISSRDVFIEGNLQLFNQFGNEIAKHAPDALIVTASNPVDALNYFLYSRFGFNRNQLIGYTRNDSLRFEWALRRNVPFKRNDSLYTPVIGEHGNTQVPVFSQIKRNDQPFHITNEQKEKVIEELRNWFINYNNLQINRTTGWTTAHGMGRLVEMLVDSSLSKTTGSAILHGEYGFSNISMGVPITINNEGIKTIDQWELNEMEQTALSKSADHLQEIIKQHILTKQI